MAEPSEINYYEREVYEEWGSRSSLSHQDDLVTQTSGRAEDIATLRLERDTLARALGAERQRGAAAARAHDARLAELHGVIAELVRRAREQRGAAIPEEELSEECESTTQPAGELDNDGDMSRTEVNETSSAVSPSELPTPQEQRSLPDDETASRDVRVQQNTLAVPAPQLQPPQPSDRGSSLRLSDSEICVTTARCCQHTRAVHSNNSCQRERGSPALLPSPGRCESREAKIASRVRLKKTEDTDNNLLTDEEWCVQTAERLALEVCAQAELSEAIAGAQHQEGCVTGDVWRTRCVRLAAECRMLEVALQRAVDTQHRLSCACALHESSSVVLCGALRAADRALETYDVLLALAETDGERQARETDQRGAAEAVAKRLLSRLEAPPAWGEPLLSPGPWYNHNNTQNNTSTEESYDWNEECEARLRQHAARLKRETVALRELRPPPALFSHHDIAEGEVSKSVENLNTTEMEAAVMMQEVLLARECKVTERAGDVTRHKHPHKSESGRDRRRRERERHWLDAQPSETDL